MNTAAMTKATSRNIKPQTAPRPRSDNSDFEAAENFMAGKALAADLLEAAKKLCAESKIELLAANRGRNVPQFAFMRDYFETVATRQHLADGFFAGLSAFVATSFAGPQEPDEIRGARYLDCVGGPDTAYVDEEEAQRLASGGKPPAPAAAGTPAADPQGNMAQVKDHLYSTLKQARSVTWMVGRMCSTEFEVTERPDEACICESVQLIARLLQRAFTISDVYSGPAGTGLGGELCAELIAARGLSATLDAMIWADEMTIAASSEIMMHLLDALESCISRALAWLHPDLPPNDPDLFFAEAKAPGVTAEGN